MHQIGNNVLDEYGFLEGVDVDAFLTSELLEVTTEEAFVGEFFFELEDASLTSPLEDVPPLEEGSLDHL